MDMLKSLDNLPRLYSKDKKWGKFISTRTRVLTPVAGC
jgi:hypothetical protein